MTDHPGTIVRHHDVENYPQGTTPHTTAPLDYLIAGLASSLGSLTAQPLDLAGALISPLLALGAGWFLWWWARRMKLAYRWAGLLLFAVSPILADGTALGRPDHQSLLLLLLLIALAAEWTLRERISRGWGIVSGLSWGLACWVSLYKPAVLLAIVSLTARGKLWRPDRRLGWLLFAGILLLAALVERRWPQVPATDLHDFYSRWSATIGELKHVSLTNPIWLQWFGGFELLAPVLLVLALKRGKLPRSLGALLLLAFLLTIWQARWGYFLALILCLTIPVLLEMIHIRWLRVLLVLLAFVPFLFSWDRILWPNEEVATECAAARREAVEWRAAATALRSSERQPFLAPWCSGRRPSTGRDIPRLRAVLMKASPALSRAPSSSSAPGLMKLTRS